VKRLLFTLLMTSFVSFVGAQVDEIVYNREAKSLSYVMDYERVLDNAVARDCSSAAFESSLLHTTLRTLFLYLPYEASFYEGVETLEVRALQEDNLVLYAMSSLQEIRDTNARFRVYMNSFASSRAGFCFALENSVIESWINTLTARGGRVAINTNLLETRLEGLQDIAGLEIPGLGEATAPALQPEPAQPEAPAQPTEQQAVEQQPVQQDSLLPKHKQQKLLKHLCQPFSP
jgi:hypothetical protein